MLTTENLKTLKYHIFSKKTLAISIMMKYNNEDKKLFKQKESIEILLKILDLIIYIEEYQNKYD